MQIIGCQTDICWHDKEANFRAVRALLEPATIEPNSWIVLPEMFATGFSMQAAELAENALGPTHKFLASLARDYQSYVVGGVIGRAGDGRGLNQAAVFRPDGSPAGVYDKLHPFSFAGETRYYAGGRDVLVCEAGPWRVAPLVCYDLRFPEVFRRATQRGANLLLVIANWPSARVAHWTQLLIARAIENQCFVVGVNRAGRDPKLEYPGGSLIIDPRGQVLAQLGAEPGLLRCELDLDTLLEYRRIFPALADIRPEFLGPAS